MATRKPIDVPLTIERLVFEAHGTAKSKGWHDTADPEDVNQQLAWAALVHSEVSEAVEDIRKGNIGPGFKIFGEPDEGGHFREPSKPIGLPSELADAMIRIADMAGAMGIDLEAAIRLKLNYNTTRSRRHGGKLA